MSELKNCPFCGGDAETKMYLWGEKRNGEAIWCYYIFCTNCQSMSDNVFTDKDCAITAWNTRTAAPRFTAEERDAMILIGDTCNAYLHNYRFGTAEYVKLYGAIATVRKMLEE